MTERWSALFVLLGLLGVFTGCSLLSGWSDLQGGSTKPAGDDDDDAPDSSTPAKTDGSTSTKDSGTPKPTGGVHCGSLRCGDGQICCANGQNKLVCAADGACSGVALPCSTHADCPDDQQCCLGSGNGGSSCKAACSASEETLCNASDTTACAAGQSCALITTSLPDWLSTCN